KGERRVARDDEQLAEASTPAPRTTTSRISRSTGPETELTFVNKTSGEIEVFWLSTQGQRQSYGKIAVGERSTQHTFAGHVWEVASGDGRTLGTFQAEEAATTAEIDGQSPRSTDAGTGNGAAQRGFGGGRGGSSRWRDRKWT